MDTIKKKMLAMKNEKDAAIDRAEQLEQSLRDVEKDKSSVRLVFNFQCIVFTVLFIEASPTFLMIKLSGHYGFKC